MKKKLNKVFSRAKSQNKVYQPTLARIRVNKKNNSSSWWKSIYNLFF